MDTYSMDIICVWFGFSYLPHFLSVSGAWVEKEKERTAFAVLLEIYSIAKMFFDLKL